MRGENRNEEGQKVRTEPRYTTCITELRAGRGIDEALHDEMNDVMGCLARKVEARGTCRYTETAAIAIPLGKIFVIQIFVMPKFVL